MSLRSYLLSIALTWATGLAGFLLIQHGHVASALLMLFSYWCIVITVAFKLKSREHRLRFKFIGAHDKHDPYEDCEL